MNLRDTTEFVESYPQRVWNCPKCHHENMVDDDCFVLGEAHNQECIRCREIFVVTQ